MLEIFVKVFIRIQIPLQKALNIPYIFGRYRSFHDSSGIAVILDVVASAKDIQKCIIMLSLFVFSYFISNKHSFSFFKNTGKCKKTFLSYIFFQPHQKKCHKDYAGGVHQKDDVKPTYFCLERFPENCVRGDE